MRLLTRVLALSVTSATLVALAPGTAFAAATRTAEAPAANSVVSALPSTISATFANDTILLAPPPTFTVTGPTAQFACAGPTVTAHALSCVPSHPGATAYADGLYTVTYSFSSAPGGATSGSYTFWLDQTGPTGLAISPSPYNLATPAGTQVTVSGTSLKGATVKVSLATSAGGSPVVQTVAASASNGGFTTSFAAPADGTLTATANVTSGGTDGPVASVTSLKDRLLPSIVSTSPVAGGAEQPTTGGNPSGYTVTADGPLDHASTVRLFDATHAELSTTKTFPAADQVAIVPASTLPDGTYTVEITLKDAAGNSAAFPTRSFAIDHISPAAPHLGMATDPVNIAHKTVFGASGTAEANAHVTVSITSGATTLTPSTTAAADGTFAVANVDVSSLADGTLTVTATATDAAGNASVVSNTLSPVKDTVAPVLSGQAFDQTTYNAATAPTAHVTGVVGDGAGGHEADTVTVSVDDTDPSTPPVVATGPSSASTGLFSVPMDLSSLKDTTLTATVTTADASGNPATPVTTTAGHDSLAPAQPTVVAPTYANSANQSAYVVSGTTDPSVNVTVTITDSGAGAAARTASRTVTSDGTGSYTASLDLATPGLIDGPLSVSVVATDPHGNPSTAGTATRTKDTVAPGAPTGLVAPTWINGVNTAAVPVSGSGEVGAHVTVAAHDPGSAHLAAGAPATVQPDGTWSTTVDTSTFGQGTATFDVTLTDAAGNTSGPTTVTSTKDTVAPTAATGLASTPSAYLYASRNGTLTVTGSTQNDNNLVVDLTVADTDPATPDLTVTGLATTAGAFSHVFSAAEIGSLTDSTLTVTAVVRDLAGNGSTPATLSVVKDTTKLAQLSLTPADGSVQQSVSSVDAGFNEALDQAASTITVKNRLGNTLAGATTFSADGKTMTFTPGSAFNDAGSPFTVTVHGVDLNDAADTVSSGPTTFSVDTTPPATPAITSVTDPVNAASAAAFAGSGTATDPTATAVTLTVTSGAHTVSSTVPVTGGSWSVSNLDVRSLPDGTLTVTATAQDAVGNVSPAASTTAKKDTVAPVMTVHFAKPYTGQANVASTLLSGTVGNGSGAAEADVVSLSVNDADPATAAVTTTVTAGADGTFSKQLDLHTLKDGTLTVTAHATDAVGNVSAAATATAIKDVVAPAAPVFTVAETVTPTGRTLVATGTAEPGAHVTLGAFDPATDGPLVDVVANPTTGAFTTALDVRGLATDLLAAGALATDAAGNAGPETLEQVPTATGITVDAATAANHFVTTIHGKLAEPSQLGMAASDGTTTVSGGTFTVDNAGNLVGTLDLTTLAPGQVALALYTKDADGNSTLTLTVGTRAWGTSTVALNALPAKVVAGSPITIAGTVRRTDPSVAVRTVQVVGRDASGRVALRTNLGVSSTGTFAYRYAPRVNLSYTVTYLGDTRNHPATSVRRTVLAAAKVSASAPTGSHTGNAVVSGGVFPAKAGKVVTLYRVTSTGSLVRLKTATLTTRSAYRFTVLLPKGYTTLVVAIPATPGNAAGSIRFRALRT